MPELKINEIDEVSGGNMPEGSVGGDTIPPGTFSGTCNRLIMKFWKNHASIKRRGN